MLCRDKRRIEVVENVGDSIRRVGTREKGKGRGGSQRFLAYGKKGGKCYQARGYPGMIATAAWYGWVPI